MAYEAAILNAKAHKTLAIAKKNRTHEIHFIKIGSSHVGQDGFGQSDACIKSLHDLNYRFVITQPMAPSDGAMFDQDGALGVFTPHTLPGTGTEGLIPPGTVTVGSSMGYGWGSVPTASRAALALLPVDLIQYVVKGWDGAAEQNPGLAFAQPWCGVTARTDNGVGMQTDGITDVIHQDEDLIGWVAFGDDPTFSGGASIGFRRADAPTSQITSEPLKAMGRATGLYLESVALAAGVGGANRVFPHRLNLQVNNVLGTLTPSLIALACLIENSAVPWGVSCSPLIYYGGAGLRLFRQQIINSFDDTVSLCGVPLMKLITGSRFGKAKKYVVDITWGSNDQNDTTLSVDGVNNSNTVTGAIANLMDLIDRVRNYFLSELSIAFTNIYFRVRIDTPVSFPDDADLVAYRAALVAILPALTALRVLVIDAMQLGSEAEYGTWWKTPGVDQTHLNAEGYYQIELRQMQGYFSKLESLLGGGLSPYWKQELTGE